MAEFVNPNDENIEEVIVKTKRKRHIWWRILLAILIVILIPIGLVYGLFYDKSTKDISNIDKNLDTAKLGSNVLIDAFSSAEKYKKIEMKMSENQLNSLFYIASTRIPDAAKKYLPKMYCDIDEKNETYNFYVDALVPMFQTRLCISTLLTDYVDFFAFKIVDVKAGRIGGLDWIVKKYVPQSTIEDVFKNAGLSIKFSTSDMTLTYNKDDMLKDMTTMMGEIAASSNLFVSLFKELNSLELISVHSGKSEVDKYLALDVDLESLTTNDKYVRTDETLMHQTIKEAMADAIADIKEDDTSIDSTTASDNLQEYLDELPLLQYCKANYGSDYLKTVASTKEVDGGNFSANIVVDPLNPLDSYVEGYTSVSNDEIDNFILSAGIVGKTTGFYNKDSKKFAYITINDMYANIQNDSINFVITLDINGLDTYIIIPTTVVSSNEDVNYKLDLSIGNILIGENEITTETLIGQLMNEYLKPTITSEDGLISVSDDNKTLTLNFEDAFEEGMENYGLESYSDITKFKVTTYGVDKDDDDAYIGIEFEAESSI